MKQKGWTLYELLFVTIILGGIWGWVWNIVKLAGMTFDPITGMAVLRTVGIFIPPVGAVVGYI